MPVSVVLHMLASAVRPMLGLVALATEALVALDIKVLEGQLMAELAALLTTAWVGQLTEGLVALPITVLEDPVMRGLADLATLGWEVALNVRRSVLDHDRHQ